MATSNRRFAAGLIFAGIATGMLAACGGGNVKEQIPPVAHVDVPRFMGDWYVIAQIPTRIRAGIIRLARSFAANADHLDRLINWSTPAACRSPEG